MVFRSLAFALSPVLTAGWFDWQVDRPGYRDEVTRSHVAFGGGHIRVGKVLHLIGGRVRVRPFGELFESGSYVHSLVRH